MLYRHLLLGFKPRIAYLPGVADVRKSVLGIRCDTSGALNRRTAILFRFPPNRYPLLVISRHQEIVDRAVAAHQRIALHARTFEDWYQDQPHRLASDQIHVIEDEVNAILQIARSSTAAGEG